MRSEERFVLSNFDAADFLHGQDPKVTFELGHTWSALKERTAFNRQISSQGFEQGCRPSMHRQARASLGFACCAQFQALASGANVPRLVRPRTSSCTKQ